MKTTQPTNPLRSWRTTILAVKLRTVAATLSDTHSKSSSTLFMDSWHNGPDGTERRTSHPKHINLNGQGSSLVDAGRQSIKQQSRAEINWSRSIRTRCKRYARFQWKKGQHLDSGKSANTMTV